MKSLLKAESGQVAIIFALLLPVFIGFAAISVDVGRLYFERRELQKAADLAALAGVQELPNNPDNAVNIASQYADQNAQSRPLNKEIRITSTYIPNDTIEVKLNNPQTNLFFARIWEKNSSNVSAGAVAVISSPSAYGRGVMPFGIMSKEPTATSVFGYEFSETVTLKEPSQQGEAGNYYFLDIIGEPENQGGGANDIYAALSNGGAPNPVYIGRLYYTQTGINGRQVVNNLEIWITCNHTFDEICTDIDEEGIVTIENPENESPWCHRLVICPIIINPDYPEADPRRYNWSEISGSKKVLIVGFAMFFIESWGTVGSNSYVTGRFVRVVDENAIDFGAYTEFAPVVYRLIK